MNKDINIEKTKELLKNYLDDINSLIISRNKKKYNWENRQFESRSVLFLVAVLSSYKPENEIIENLTLLKDKVVCLSNNFFNDLLKKIKSYQSYFNYTGKTRYKFNNEKILDMLNVNPEEERELNIILSKSEKERRANEPIRVEQEKIRIDSEIEESYNHWRAEKELKQAMENENNVVSDEILFSYRDSIFDNDI